MDSEKYLNDSEGQSVRKNWLMSLYLFAFMGVINEGFDYIGKNEFYLTFFFIFLWILYHCAYKKHGRKFLGFYIFTEGIFYLNQSIAGFMNLIYNYADVPYILVLFVTVNIIIGGYFIFNCCWLFQLNSTIHNRPKNEQGYHLTDS